MIVTARRIARDDASTVSAWMIDGHQVCYCLEPGAAGAHPAIPSGSYKLGLRTVGDKHKAYLKWYGPKFHKGMIEILDVPNREAILFHVGNTIADTQGCSLCGERAIDPRVSNSEHWEVARSRVTYEKIYPPIRDAIAAGPVTINIIPVGETHALA